MLRIEVVDTNIITRRKRDNTGDYYQQVAYVYTIDRDGSENRFPEKVFLFAPKDKNGNPRAYQAGFYTFSPDSLRVRNGRLEVGFINLVPVKTQQGAAA